MSLLERIDRLMRIAYHIQLEETGTPEDFAKKMELKPDRLTDYINVVRDLASREDAEVKYDRDRKTYYFSPHGKITDIKFKISTWVSHTLEKK